jgi:hypothetical protein
MSVIELTTFNVKPDQTQAMLGARKGMVDAFRTDRRGLGLGRPGRDGRTVPSHGSSGDPGLPACNQRHPAQPVRLRPGQTFTTVAAVAGAGNWGISGDTASRAVWFRLDWPQS